MTFKGLKGLRKYIGVAVMGLSAAPMVFLPNLYFFIGVVAGIFLHFQCRCPRCGALVYQDTDGFELSYPGVKTSETCYRCGRNRKGVWPLQYWLKREPWDGTYDGPTPPPHS